MPKNLEFGYTTGQTLTAQLFAIGGNTILATAASVTEKTNAKSRYTAVFNPNPANGDYLLIVFLAGNAVTAENYTINASTTSQPWREANPSNVSVEFEPLSILPPSIAALFTGGSIAVYRGTTWVIPIVLDLDISAYDVIYMSVKKSVYDVDDDAAILRVNNTELERFNEAAPGNAANGIITINDAVTGDITVTVQEEETVNAPIGNDYVYDVKGIDNDGNVDMLSANGNFTIAIDVTRKIT